MDNSIPNGKAREKNERNEIWSAEVTNYSNGEAGIHFISISLLQNITSTIKRRELRHNDSTMSQVSGCCFYRTIQLGVELEAFTDTENAYELQLHTHTRYLSNMLQSDFINC